MIRERDFPGRRWISIVLRTLHLTGVVLAAAGVVGHAAPSVAGVLLMLVTGVALHALDLWHHPGLWREVAGIFVIFKLVVVLAMLMAPGAALPLFWLLVVSSSVVSHAPYAFRHNRLIR